MKGYKVTRREAALTRRSQNYKDIQNKIGEYSNLSKEELEKKLNICGKDIYNTAKNLNVLENYKAFEKYSEPSKKHSKSDQELIENLEVQNADRS